MKTSILHEISPWSSEWDWIPSHWARNGKLYLKTIKLELIKKSLNRIFFFCCSARSLPWHSLGNKLTFLLKIFFNWILHLNIYRLLTPSGSRWNFINRVEVNKKLLALKFISIEGVNNMFFFYFEYLTKKNIWLIFLNFYFYSFNIDTPLNLNEIPTDQEFIQSSVFFAYHMDVNIAVS